MQGKLTILLTGGGAQAKRASTAGGPADEAAPGGEGAPGAPRLQGRNAKGVRRAQPGGAAAGAPDSSTVHGAGVQQHKGEPGSRDRPVMERPERVVTTSDAHNKRSKRARQGDAGGVRGPTDAGKGGMPKRRKTEAERGDKLDSMVAQYRAQIFGDAEGKGGGRVVAKSSMQRWFE